MSKKIKIAVVGAGHLGRFHARLLSKHPEYELLAVVDPSLPARTSVAEEVGVKSYESIDLLPEGGEINAAVIATPTKYHCEIGEALLKKRLHLLIEKPLALNLSQADALVSIAATENRVLQVGHIERFNPALKNVYQQVSQPHFIDARRHGGYSFRSTDIGVVLDLMIHDVDIALSLMKSKPIRIDAVGSCVVGPHEDIATARLVFEGGGVANLSASRVSEKIERRMHIWGSQYLVDVDYTEGVTRFTRSTDTLKRGQLDPDCLCQEEKKKAQESFFSEWLQTEKFEVEACNALDDELTDFATAINTGQPVRVDGSAGRDAVAVCEQILERMVQHVWDGADRGDQSQRLPSPATIPVSPASHSADTLRRRAG
ncbi:MAG: hypothetical protein CBB70_14815 [Planctomycetaceae bacterium TMED10]|nr:MAG: hypothetical protein CBB70_14815 [Planctomycetaceae bacterium TMED10]